MRDISIEDKLKIMPHVILLLKTINEIKKYGFENDMLYSIKGTKDEFLKLCLYMVMNGYNPSIVRRILENLVENEKNPLLKLLKTIQMDLATSMYEDAPMRNVCMLAFSHFGMEFKGHFIEELKKADTELYNLVVEDDELYCFRFYEYVSEMEKTSLFALGFTDKFGVRIK